MMRKHGRSRSIPPSHISKINTLISGTFSSFYRLKYGVAIGIKTGKTFISISNATKVADGGFNENK